MGTWSAVRHAAAHGWGCLLLLGVLVAWGLPARAEGLATLAHNVRIIRYAATGNTARIEGSDATPAERQAWLNAIAAALAEANGFFREIDTAVVTDKPHGTYTAYSLGDPIVLTVNPGADGVIDESDIGTALGLVNWIVALKYPDSDTYRYRPDVLSGAFGGMGGTGNTRDQALANAGPYTTTAGDTWHGLYPLTSPALPDDPASRDLAWYYCHGCMGYYQSYFMGACHRGSFWVTAGAMVVNGGYRLPAARDGVPVAGPGDPPAARIALYYAMPFGPGVPRGLAATGFDTGFVTTTHTPADVVPAEPACDPAVTGNVEISQDLVYRP